jgi:ABC-type uncharacterized transport system substrate-binding protein
MKAGRIAMVWKSAAIKNRLGETVRYFLACCFFTLVLVSSGLAHGQEPEASPEAEALPIVTVHLDSVPKGAKVLVDNVPVCHTPCYDKFREGPHLVSMQAKWYLRNWEEVILEEGSRIKFVLEKKKHQVDALVIRSKKFALYDKAIEGFREVFKGTVNVMTLSGQKDEEERLLTRVRTLNPRVILTVGLLASWMTVEFVHSAPIVFCMAPDSVDKRLKGETSTGVYTEPALGEQLRAISDVLPWIERMGVIYDPKISGTMVSVMMNAAVERGMELIEVPVKDHEEVPAALGQVLEKAQALWLIRDHTVLTPEFFHQVVQIQLQKKFPVIAYSDQFVWHGALCSFSSKYRQQGIRAGELANSILSGADPKDIPVQDPEGTLVINLETASRLHYLPPLLTKFLPKPVIKFESR